jgi:hypothetical protein
MADAVQPVVAAAEAVEEQADAEAPLLGEDGVRHVLINCGFATIAQQDSVILEGFDDIEVFADMQKEDFRGMASRISRLRVNQGGFRFAASQIRNLEALAWWVRDRRRQGEDLVAREFTVEVRKASMREMDVERARLIKASGVTPPMTMKFESSKWVVWEQKF